MLEPAFYYREELLDKFSKELYTERYFYYMGYVYGFELPNFEPHDNVYQYAVIDNKDKETVIGYFSYRVDSNSDAVYNFGLYSFDEGNLQVIRDVYKKLEELINRYHRVEWRCIGGNHAAHGYKSFCKRHNGYIHILHDVTKDIKGEYRDEYLYEIIRNEEKS